ncbi:HTR4 [Branchiostoma lanceolatum]|uniref:HTR4 protein n=1 Tax=Branchiostoma lanceolatum TaxID=7740 RepID=A0A8K0A4U5_BRALA|nr:HTR4 [Branchiostoma lanceolatum]
MNGSGPANDTSVAMSSSQPGWHSILPAELKVMLVGLIGLGLVLGNTFVVVVILKSPSLRNYTGYLTVSLACADMLPGLLVIPFSLRPAWTGQWMYGDVICMLATFISCVCALGSSFSLVGLAINRYILIVHAMRYQNIMGPKLCTAMIVAAWVVPAISFAVPIFVYKRFRFLPSSAHCTFELGEVIPLAFGVAFIAVLVMVVGILHCKVYAVALRHLKNIHHYNRRATLDKLQGAKTTAVITVAFLLTWVPYCALAIWQNMLEYPTHPDVEFVVLWLYTCNGILNVFIYNGLNRAFREEAKKLTMRTCVLNMFNVSLGVASRVTTPSTQARSSSKKAACVRTDTSTSPCPDGIHAEEHQTRCRTQGAITGSRFIGKNMEETRL